MGYRRRPPPETHLDRFSAINSETAFALKYWGLDTPPLFETYEGGKGKVCLMDHNQVSQIAKGTDLNSICGVIDHHALQVRGATLRNLPLPSNP